MAPQAAQANTLITHVKEEPKPNDAPGFRTRVKESKCGTSSMFFPSLSVAKAQSFVMRSSTTPIKTISAKTATRVRSRFTRTSLCVNIYPIFSNSNSIGAVRNILKYQSRTAKNYSCLPDSSPCLLPNAA